MLNYTPDFLYAGMDPSMQTLIVRMWQEIAQEVNPVEVQVTGLVSSGAQAGGTSLWQAINAQCLTPIAPYSNLVLPNYGQFPVGFGIFKHPALPLDVTVPSGTPGLVIRAYGASGSPGIIIGDGDGYSAGKGAVIEYNFTDDISYWFAYDFLTAAYKGILLDGLSISLNSTSTGPVGIGIVNASIPTDSWLTLPGYQSGGVHKVSARFLPANALLPSPVDGSWEYNGTDLWFTIGSTRHQVAPVTGGSFGSFAPPYLVDGSGNYYFGGGIQCFPPGTTASGLTWTSINLSHPTVPATITTGPNNNMVLTTGSNAATDTIVGTETPVPRSTPYTITAAFNFSVPGNTSAGGAVLWIRDSVGGKIMLVSVQNTSISVTTWTGITPPLNASSLLSTTAFFMGPMIWVKIVNNGTNLQIATSSDGVYWTPLSGGWTTGSTVSLALSFFANAPNTCGWGSTSQAPFGTTMTCLSFSV